MSSFAVAVTVLGASAHAEQPVLPPPPAPTAQPALPPPPTAQPLPAPETAPAAPTQAPAPPPQPAEQHRPQQGPPPTSEYPALPPVPSQPAAATAMPRGTAPPGATPAMMLPPPAPRRFKYYSLAVMVADAAWIVAATQEPESPLLYVGGYIVAAPLAHLLMGNQRSAWISAGLRAGAVAFTTGALVHAFESPCGECSTEIGLVLTGLLGAATIMVADWVVLAKREVAVPVQPRSAPDWAVAPQVQVGEGGLQLGVGGWF